MCEKMSINYRTPKLDTPTRWNSSYEMISALKYLRDPLTQLVQVDKDLRNMMLSYQEWDNFSELIEFLTSFNDTTEELSASNRVTLIEILPIIEHIKLEILNSDDKSPMIKALIDSA